ncbi:MAG: SRPBCC domain-containing protein [Pseudomonadota bacterium]
MSLPFIKSPPGETPVVAEIEVAASTARAFRAFTDPADIKKWFGPGEPSLARAHVELRTGGLWEFAFSAGEDGQIDTLRGSYLEIRPGERLVFTWQHERVLADGQRETTAQSLVTVTFETSGKGAFVRLVHEGIAARSGRLGVADGWNHSMQRIAALVEEELAPDRA